MQQKQPQRHNSQDYSSRSKTRVSRTTVKRQRISVDNREWDKLTV